MLKKILVILVVVAVILVGVWLFSGVEEHGQIVTVDSDLNMYPFGYCYVAAMFRAVYEDGTIVTLLADAVLTSPDGDIHTVTGMSGISGSDSFCNDDWIIEINPFQIQIPSGGQKRIDGELYEYTTAVAEGHSEILTFTFEWK